MGIGHAPELILILLVVLLVFGAGRLPEVAQGLGRGIRDFRKALADERDESSASVEHPNPPPDQPPSGHST